MSILSFPRIYFNGFMQWDVCTANNNDYSPVYDMKDAALNWSYLAQFGITPENFRDQFRPWVIAPEQDVVQGSGASDNCPDCAGGNPNTHMLSRWNYYGSAGTSTVQYNDSKTTVVGGVTAPGVPSPTDPLIGTPVSLLGNQSGGSSSPGRLIDIDPSAPWVSQILLDSLSIGNDTVSLAGQVTSRMFSRDFMVPRNLDSNLMIAGAIGATFQTTIAAKSLQIQNPGNQSPLLAALQKAMQQPGVAGVMFRMTAYNTLYYQNGIFNGTTQRPKGCCDIWKLYKSGQVFTNPAYSRINGTFGVWREGELATSPGGHVLIPANPLQPVTPATMSAVRIIGAAGHRTTTEAAPAAAADAAGGGAPTLPPWGIAYLEIDYDRKVATVDLSNAILGATAGAPSYTQGANFNVGPMSVGVANGTSFLTIGTIPYDGGYDGATYNTCSGIYDVAFADGVTPQAIRDAIAASGSQLALRAGAPNNVNACQEQPWTAQSDHRGTYLEQGETLAINVQVRYRGGVPPAGTKVRLAQYYGWPPQVGSGSWMLTPPPPVPPPLNVKFVDGDTIPVDAKGNAVVRIEALNPGFPIVVMYPYGPGGSLPVVQQNIAFNSQPVGIQTAQNIVVRVLPFDDGLYSEFRDRWNGTGKYAGQPKYDRTLAWQFVYNRILYVYDMLYPVMDRFMPLGDLPRIEGAVDQLQILIQKEMLNSTLYMPVTRELSNGKRTVLESWCSLIIRKYPPENLPPNP